MALSHNPQHWYITWRLFSSNSFAVSSALAELCSLLSAILVSSAKEVMFLSAFVCYHNYAKTIPPVFTNLLEGSTLAKEETVRV